MATAHSLILVGFMGAGKTSVGRALAAMLGWTFEDLDDRIERRMRRTVPEIFHNDGEAAFRRAEHAALQESLHELRTNHRIIALGGGAFVRKQNVNLIEAAGLATVFLDASGEELWRRCCEQSAGERVERPLLGDLESFRELYAARRSHYLNASFRLSTNGKSVEQVAIEIIAALSLESCSQGEKQ